MTRNIFPTTPQEFGRRLVAGEPVIFHCNHYNYWLQKTLLMVEDMGIEDLLVDAAAVQGYALTQADPQKSPRERLQIAADTFAQQGFGRIDFAEITEHGGTVITPNSHYGQCLSSACNGDFAVAQNFFDRGYIAGAVAGAFNLPLGALAVGTHTCLSLKADQARIQLVRQEAPEEGFIAAGEGFGARLTCPPVTGDTNINEGAIHQALAGLDFSGNEEGLIPRFGVMLTDHFANYYNRISFEFVQRMKQTGLLDYAEELLIEAGHRCAFNTFGGIMTSPEWDAVVLPQCQKREDWIYGICSVINVLGWGVWRVHDISPDHLTLRIYDDYESRGYIAMYGRATRNICYLAMGGAAGLMNLVFSGEIHEKPVLDEAFYERIFNSDQVFSSRQTKCLAKGDPYSEICVRKS